MLHLLDILKVPIKQEEAETEMGSIARVSRYTYQYGLVYETVERHRFSWEAISEGELRCAVYSLDLLHQWSGAHILDSVAKKI